jgi:hypothetical protein
MVGIVMLAVMTRKAMRGGYAAGTPVGLEDGATYWHMIDLLWVMIFPLLYLARKRGLTLSITHKSGWQAGTDFDVDEARLSSPHNDVAGRWIMGAGEVAAEFGDLGQVMREVAIGLVQ